MVLPCWLLWLLHPARCFCPFLAHCGDAPLWQLCSHGTGNTLFVNWLHPQPEVILMGELRRQTVNCSTIGPVKSTTAPWSKALKQRTWMKICILQISWRERVSPVSQSSQSNRNVTFEDRQRWRWIQTISETCSECSDKCCEDFCKGSHPWASFNSCVWDWRAETIRDDAGQDHQNPCQFVKAKASKKDCMHEKHEISLAFV